MTILWENLPSFTLTPALRKRVVQAVLTGAVLWVPAPAGYCEPPASATTLPAEDVRLDLTKIDLWKVDRGHLGTGQIKIDANAAEQAVVLTPTWSAADRNATEPGVRNVDHGVLQSYQLIPPTDSTQVETAFEINMPREYIAEGKMEFVFSLQAGALGDYLFNGRTFTMADFKDTAGQYKKIVVKAADFNEPAQKLRAIERINFIFSRNGSVVSAPIKIRGFVANFNRGKIIPPEPEVKVKNPKSYYSFVYNTQKSIDAIGAHVGTEDIDITRKLNKSKNGMLLLPHWIPGQMPAGHSGKVSIYQPLGAIHDFEQFEVQYTLNIPKAYFDEGKLDMSVFIQAGATGLGRWSGARRKLADFADRAGKDVVLTLTDQDVKAHGKKRNQIELVGLQFNPHDSNIIEPITVKRIVVKLPE